MAGMKSSAIWVDASEFSSRGGWELDTQFTYAVGAACLVANGIGSPVADAHHQAPVTESGEYRVWVLARNWLPEYTPGTFRLRLSHYSSDAVLGLDRVFGADGSGDWLWEDGGVVRLERGRLILTLSDQTGWYGRCGAILLTTDPAYRPPSGADAMFRERERIKGWARAAAHERADLLVAGAGIAGVCAAVAAARLGLRVTLLQDRGVVGGNASSECCVSLNGAAPRFDHARAGGIVEEIARERHARNEYGWSGACRALIEAEPTLDLHLHQRVIGVEQREDRSIEAVLTVDPVTGRRDRFGADAFVDATGDGWLGYHAGAEFRQGREARRVAGAGDG